DQVRRLYDVGEHEGLDDSRRLIRARFAQLPREKDLLLLDHDRPRWAGHEGEVEQLVINRSRIEDLGLGELTSEPVERGWSERDAVAGAKTFVAVDAYLADHQTSFPMIAIAVASAREEAPSLM